MGGCFLDFFSSLLICVKDGELRVLETGGRLVLCFVFFGFFFLSVILLFFWCLAVIATEHTHTQKKGSLLYSIFLQLGGIRGGVGKRVAWGGGGEGGVFSFAFLALVGW